MSTRAHSGPEPFGTYLLDRLIAEGGMARVYLARLRGVAGFEKALVVKQIKPVFAQDPEFVALFVQEAKTLVRLSHPHVVPIYELGVVDGTYFIAMEHVDGVSLLELMRTAEDLALPAELVAHILVQTAEALRHAHERFGMVHRDITPRNIMVDRGGNVRLVDFGIATPVTPPELRPDSGETPTDAAPMFGSPGYMAPEQVRGAPVDGKCDVFALGCVGFEALQGTPAFYSTEPDEALSRVLKQRARVTPRPETGVDAELAALLDAMLEPNAKERPNAGAVASQLRAWLSANAPGGVAPRLSERVEALLRDRSAEEDEPLSADPGTPLRPVQTLATAALLREARDGLDVRNPDVRNPGATEAQDVGGEQAEHAPEGTVPIAGRRGSAPAEDRSVDDAQSSNPAEQDAPEAPAPATDEDASDAQAGTQGVDAQGEEPTNDAGPRPPGSPLPKAPTRGRGRFALTIALAACLGALAAWGAQRASTTNGDADLGVAGAVGGTLADGGPIDGPAVPSRAATDGGASSTGPGREVDGDAGVAALDAGPEPAPRPTSGSVLVRATPWASVEVDGRSLGRGARVTGSLPPGTHRMTLRCQPLGTSVSATLRVSPGRTTRVTADLSAPPGRVRVH